ncbi:MAG: sulfotransferase [Jatrophihabitans sp.]
MTAVGFIGGLGRSGSTLLERIIAELPGVCALGEVLHLWQRGVRDNELCACQQPFRSCPFWQRVGEEAFGGWHNIDVDVVERLHGQVDRMRYIPIDIVSGRLSARRAVANQYADYFARVYAAAARVSGAGVVVDSSKNASTAFALRAHQDIQLKVLHVVRDSRGAAYSWTKQVARPEAANTDGEQWMERYSPTVSALLWDAHNLAFAALGRLGTPTRRVFYERFLADPELGVARIADFLGVKSDAASGFLHGDTVQLRETHQVAGNPMRFRTGSLRLRQDDAWRREFPSSDVRLVTALTAPLMMRYGYALAAGPSPDDGVAG